ncbi:transporter substrate-binding domain-containing protein [Arthrobacter sp. ok362]|uniref:transporter substrate-binding domain-containing protein n=1 Tax=Arthrobacter sp. ok362 TaxID=1761745 RepID=UPI00088BF696|nr:transporter substrate-binding domain-containing protein [Arthrobacter sp. ok362]SDK58775.1 polar amino acid transport system substrate-binding protein [Arthrobacter sp. ok362]
MFRATPKLLLVPAVALALTLGGCSSGGASNGSGAATGAVADSHLTQILKSKTVRIAVSSDSPGYGVMKSDGTHEGFDIDVANALGASLGAKVEFVTATNESRIPLLQTDKADAVIATFTASDARAQVVDMSEPYAASSTVFMVPAGSPIASYADLDGKSVATSRGSVGEQILKASFPNAKITGFNTTADSIQALKSGKVDALIENNAIVGGLVKKEPSAFQVLKGDPIKPALFSIGVKQGDQTWLNYLNNFLRNYNISGQNEASLQKWFGLSLPAFLAH